MFCHRSPVHSELEHLALQQLFLLLFFYFIKKLKISLFCTDLSLKMSSQPSKNVLSARAQPQMSFFFLNKIIFFLIRPRTQHGHLTFSSFVLKYFCAGKPSINLHMLQSFTVIYMALSSLPEHCNTCHKLQGTSLAQGVQFKDQSNCSSSKS